MNLIFPIWCTNIWAAIIGTRVLGPILFQKTLTVERYLNMLQNEMENEIENLPLEVSESLILHQTGASHRNTCFVQDFPNESLQLCDFHAWRSSKIARTIT